ncbi:hypothetical protein HY639_06050 [Candidatus Woesearchaeota archaeon]|nr:hypothetical protein [Candidatus Woesearchaeota archaeon]
MTVDPDQVSGLERVSRFHFFRLFLTSLAIYLGVNYYYSEKQRLPEPVTTYQSLDGALNGSLPQHDYAKLTIEDRAGPYDPVKSGNTFLGYVAAEADVLVKDNEQTGYILRGQVYNKVGRKIGKLVGGWTGYEIRSLDDKKLGTFDGERLITPEGSLIAKRGPKTAVIIDPMMNITGIITSYDFSRGKL